MSELRVQQRGHDVLSPDQPASHSHHCDGGNSHKTVTVTTNLFAHIFLLSVCTTIVLLGIDSLGESMDYSTYHKKSISEPLANSKGQPSETRYTHGGRTQGQIGLEKNSCPGFQSDTKLRATRDLAEDLAYRRDMLNALRPPCGNGVL